MRDEVRYLHCSTIALRLSDDRSDRVKSTGVDVDGGHDESERPTESHKDTLILCRGS